MRVFLVAGRVILAATVLILAVVVGNVLRDVRSTAGEPPTQSPDAGGALSAATPTARPTNCTQLGNVSRRVAPPLEVVVETDGFKRVTSAEGGYSLRVPGSWLVTSGPFTDPSFAQANITSYEPKTAPTPDPERWMLPPSVGISFSVQVWLNVDHVALERFADNITIGPDQMSKATGVMTVIAGQPAYRFIINDEHRFQPSDRPLVVTKQTRVVWLVQSPQSERVIVMYATPGESSQLGTVEEAIVRMSITQAIASSRPVTHQPDEILAQWLYDKSGAPIVGRRAEAKLMTYAEANAAMNGPVPVGGPKPIQLLRLDHDPDDLYWLVAVSGPGLPEPRGGPFRLQTGIPATPTPTTWILYDTSATGRDLGGTGMRIANAGNWPPGFDTFPDRCR